MFIFTIVFIGNENKNRKSKIEKPCIHSLTTHIKNITPSSICKVWFINDYLDMRIFDLSVRILPTSVNRSPYCRLEPIRIKPYSHCGYYHWNAPRQNRQRNICSDGPINAVLSTCCLCVRWNISNGNNNILTVDGCNTAA